MFQPLDNFEIFWYGKDRLVWRQGAMSRKAVKALLQVF